MKALSTVSDDLMRENKYFFKILRMPIIFQIFSIRNSMQTSKKNCQEHLAKCIARVISNSTTPQLLFFICFVVSLIHFELIITQTPLTLHEVSPLAQVSEQTLEIHHEVIEKDKYFSYINMGLRWLDICLQLGKFEIFLYILGSTIFLVSIILITELVIGFKSKAIEHNLNSYYRIKITLIICCLLNYVGHSIIIRVCLYVILGPSSTTPNQIIAIITLLLYVLVIYSLPLFVLIEVSWYSQRIESRFCFPNPIFFYNLFRLLSALILIPINYKSEIDEADLELIGATFPTANLILCIISFIVIGVFLIKYPIIATNKNTLFQGLLWAFQYFLFCRIIEICTGQILNPFLLIIGSIFSGMGGLWLTNYQIFKKLRSQREEKQKVIEKIRIISYFVEKLSPENSCEEIRNYLDIFIRYHQRLCQDPLCNCHKITAICYSSEKQQENNLGSTTNKFNPPSQQKTNLAFITKKLEEEKYLWFQFIIYQIDKLGLDENLVKLSQSDRIQEIRLLLEITVDKSYIMLMHLNKVYSSRQATRQLKLEMKKQGINNLIFLIGINLLKLPSQEKVVQKIMEIDSLLWSRKFIELNKKVVNLRKQIFKATNLSKQLWSELANENVDTNKIRHNIEKLNDTFLKITDSYDKICAKFSNNSLKKSNEISNYEEIWHRKAQETVSEFYFPFLMIFDSCRQNQQTYAQLFKKLASKKVEYKLSKLMEIFDPDSQNPMCLVNINKGEQLGQICMSNKQFWAFSESFYHPKKKVSDFLPEDFMARHEKAMIDFLNDQNYTLPPLHTFVKTSKNHFREVDFFGIYSPDLLKGLRFAIFFEKSLNHPNTIITSKKSGIIGYTQNLQLAIQLSPMTMSSFSKLFINHDLISELKFKQTVQIEINKQKVEVNYFHRIGATSHDQTLRCYELVWPQVIPKSNTHYQRVHKSILGISFNLEKLSKEKSNSSLDGDSKYQPPQQISTLQQIINNDKKCKSVRKWCITNIILFILICVSGFLSIYFAFSQSQEYKASLQKNLDFSDYYSYLLHISFTLRRFNILSYEKSNGYSTEVDIYSDLGFDDQTHKFQIYIQVLTSDLKIANQLENKIRIDWEKNFQAFNFMSGKLDKSQNFTLAIIKNKFVFAPCGYVRSRQMTDFSFDYLFKQLTLPLNPIQQNLYSALYNLNYILIPTLKQQFDLFCETEINKQLQNKLNSQVQLGALAVTLISLIIIFYGIYMKLKVDKILLLSYNMLESLDYGLVQDKIEAFLSYSQFYFQDFEEQNAIMTKNNEKKKQRILSQIVEQESDVKCFDKSNIENSKNSPSGFFTFDIMNTEIKKNKKEVKKIHAKFGGVAEKKSYLTAVLCLIPLIILSVAHLVVQNYYDERIYSIMNIAFSIEKSFHETLLLRNNMQQLTLQYLSLSDPYDSISTIHNTAIQQIYDLNKNLTLKLQKQGGLETQKRYKQIQYSSICDIPIMLPKSSRLQNVREQCNDYQLKNFAGKLTEQFLVYYIEQARTLAMQIDFSNEDPTYRREQYDKMRTFFFEQTSSYQVRIRDYYREGIQIDINQVLGQYVDGVIIVSVLQITMVILICWRWMPKLMDSLYRQTSIIKMIFKIISFGQIRKNKQLQKCISQNNSHYKFLE